LNQTGVLKQRHPHTSAHDEPTSKVGAVGSLQPRYR
jgi:hypothetical protein